MSEGIRSSQTYDLTENLPTIQGVVFDPDTISLQGMYHDELSLFRAKRVWSDTLEAAFLLEVNRDFRFEVFRDYDLNKFVLKSDFLTACGRYAFWRLTNNQAPEAQYEIETAHIPDALSRHEDFVAAPDMKPISNSPLVFDGWNRELSEMKSFSQWLQEVIQKIGKSF